MKWSIAALLVAATMGVAQIPGAPGIGQSMKQNADELKHYSYKRRTEINVKDKSFGPRVDLVRYVDGKRETIPLEKPARPDQSGGRRGLRGKIVEKKIEEKTDEMKEERERLDALLHSYLSPGSDSMRAVFEKAAISRTGPGPDADVKVVAKGIMKPSDSFTLIWSVANRRPVSIDIHAELDGKPVQLTREYAVLKDGPFYAIHTVIFMPTKNTRINIDTFDYSTSGDQK
ncbi:MAG TPA: hypothetical protein VHZ74_02615 [Bryobacteraceae bacterium]|nr:hypothetical protein [Bryobacteraceae bacterium]